LNASLPNNAPAASVKMEPGMNNMVNTTYAAMKTTASVHCAMEQLNNDRLLSAFDLQTLQQRLTCTPNRPNRLCVFRNGLRD
jgi:hypothetical protein